MRYAVISNTAVLLDISLIDDLLKERRLATSSAAEGENLTILRYKCNRLTTHINLRVILGSLK